MLYDILISDVHSYRNAIIETVKQMKRNDPSITVIDIGGSISGWSSTIADAIVDINPVQSETNIRFFKVNINDERSWSSVLDYVKENGKFSYAICSHTIEDICNPACVLRILPEIAVRGTIAVPSKYHEFSRVEGPYLGYIHHRWIYDIRNGKLIGYPKLGFLEHYTKLHSLARKEDTYSQISFQWDQDIPYSFVNNDYLGPDVNSVCQYYLSLLDN